jgi:DNA topoisomerase-1
LIIAEKPSAAGKIAWALSEGKAKAMRRGRASYYEFQRGGKTVFVAPAVGHLYALAQARPSSGYPVWDLEWKPSYDVNKSAWYSRAYLANIQEIAKHASEFIAACDYDFEGETIAANILEFACGATEAKRMKFSTLTSEELNDSFENPLPSLDHGMVAAGRARHYLDWLWGINGSRALMSAIQSAGMHRIMSIGRIQGPALAMLASRDKEIKAFVPKSYWLVYAYFGGVPFMHEKGQMFDREEAERIHRETTKHGAVREVKVEEFPLYPFPPYDLTSLQMDSYRSFGFTPAQTLAIAQKLYEQGLTSYPRTSSQKLPARLGLRRIIEKLAKTRNYAELAGSLVSAGRFRPREGKKEDPAHPAVHPTGSYSEKISPQEAKVYDMITRRFLACFAEPAKREKTGVSIALGKEVFAATAARTLERGFLDFFTYARLEETRLPAFEAGREVEAERLTIQEKQTEPPARYTPASIVQELEVRNLGTKATRAEIIETLYNRGYVEGRAIQVTPFGLAVYEALYDNCPEILSEDLTRKFEGDMEEIQANKKKPEEVIDEGKRVLSRILAEFKAKEDAIGRGLLEGFKKAEKAKSLGKCPACRKGSLQVKRSKYGYFVACDKYPDCRQTYPIPKYAAIIATGKTCEKCGTPIVKVRRRARRTFEMCLDTKCETKKDWGKKREGVAAEAEAKVKVEAEAETKVEANAEAKAGAQVEVEAEAKKVKVTGKAKGKRKRKRKKRGKESG